MMFDPKFDPFAELRSVQSQQVLLLNNQRGLSNSIQEQAVLIQQMVQHLEKITKEINILDLTARDLHGRLTLLEIARKYENTDKINHN